MTNTGFINSSGIKLISYILVTALHIIVIVFVAFQMKTTVNPAEPVAGVMKLVDVQEDIPLALPQSLPLPPQLPEGDPDLPPDTQELIAETLIETDEKPPLAVIGGGAGPGISGVRGGTGTGQIFYLPQHQVTRLPKLPEDEIIRATVYPPLARRSNKEGIVYLELFTDRQGNVRQVNILREDPPGWGFGQAAVNAFKGIKGEPGESDGQPVAVRYRYPIRFTLK